MNDFDLLVSPKSEKHTILTSKYNSVVYEKQHVDMITAVDDNIDYVYSLIILDAPYENNNFVLYLSNETIATVLCITYGLRMLTDIEEYQLEW